MRFALLTLPLLLATGVATADDGCASIVAATVAEMRAGSTDWSAEREEQVRAAAGAACVKAQSGLYRPAEKVTEEAAAGSVAVPAPVSATESAEATAASVPAPASVSTTESAEEQDDAEVSIWPTLKRNEISGSPNKKPYQRKRD